MRRPLGLASVMLSLGLLAGACGGSGDVGSNGAGEKVTIKYWDFVDPAADDPRGVVLKENIAAFENKYPNIKVDVQVVPYADMLTRLPQAAAANQTPDVVRMFSTAVPVMIKAGAYRPMSDYVADVPKDDWLQPWDSTIFDGEKMVMPYEYRANALLYNAKLLDAAGVSVPKTWDQLVDAAAKVARQGKVGFAGGFSKSQDAQVLMELFESVLFQLDQPVFTQSGEAAFDTPQGTRFFQLFTQLRDAGALHKGVVEGTYETTQESLMNGTAGMAALGTHRLKTIQQANPDIKWAPLPTFPDGTEATVITGWTLGIGRSSKHPQEAAEFIKYMTGPEAQAKLARGGEVPARKSAAEDPYFKTADGKLISDFAEYIARAGQIRQYPATWGQLAQVMAEGMQALYLKGTSAEETARNIVTSYNDKASTG